MARVDPYKNFRFRVEIDGLSQAGFSECHGLGSRVEVIEYREGAEPTTVRKLPGRVSYPDITLKWGVTDSRELYNWHRAVLRGQIQRKACSIVLLDDMGQERVRWNVSNAWPSKWDGPAFNAKGSDVAIETLTISCEGVELAE
ncbi:MAG TPA: phage tail protein [Gemmatimonadales bacterium]|jgi:phage tail-like protein